MRKQRFVMFFLCIALINSILINTHAQEVTAFSDVPSSFWAYESIMDMVDKGLFKGTSAPINGVGRFSPDDSITRAEFLTVLTRYLFPDELANNKQSSNTPWYRSNFNVALEEGLLLKSEFGVEQLDQACTRQEMAMFLVRAVTLGNEKLPKEVVSSNKIPDYALVNEYYREYVIQAYSMGLIAGTDSKGTFEPNGILNRAEAATVLYRLLDPTTRKPVFLGEYDFFEWPNGITYEGEYSKGEANGYGKMTFPEIGVYAGYFVDGKREGLGTFSWYVGDRYTGSWKDDVMSGEGTYTFSDGYTIRGEWEDNQIKIRKFKLNTDKITVECGAITNIIADIDPINTTEEIVWKSSNEAIVTVNGRGNLCEISAHSIGKAKITATASNGKKSTCSVTVTPATQPVYQIELNYGDYHLDVGEKVSLDVTFVPENTTNTDIIWTSSKKSVATVNTKGVVTAKSAGTTIIQATTNSGLVATCYVVVEDPAELLWDGTWTLYEADKDGDKAYGYNVPYESEIDVDHMVFISDMYPFYENEIDLVKDGSYRLQGIYYYDDIETYELTFTSINDRKLILEVNHVYSYTYSEDCIYTEYYVLYRD